MAAVCSNSYKQQQISTPKARELGLDSPCMLGHPDAKVAAPHSTPPPLPRLACNDQFHRWPTERRHRNVPLDAVQHGQR